MNDSTIIKAISKVHVTIIDLLILISLTLFSIYFTLHVGLKLDKLILPGIKAEQLYIKWDEKISVEIDSLSVTKSSEDKPFHFPKLDIKKVMANLGIFDSFFSHISIKNITFEDGNATFSYTQKKGGLLKLQNSRLILHADMQMNDHLILLNIKEFSDFPTKTTLQAQLIADSNTSHLYGNINFNPAGVMPLAIQVLADTEKVDIYAQGAELFKESIKPAVMLTGLDPAVVPWVADYHSGESIDLKFLKGRLYYDQPISFLDSLEANAYYDKLIYHFAPGFAPAITDHTILTFKDRILSIYPKEATFYNQDGGKTWLDINFDNPMNPLLTVDVDTTAMFVPEMLPWLKGYNINLPFYQTKGDTTIKLSIGVTLHDIEVTSKGHFSTPKATFNFSDTDIEVDDVYVELKDTHIDIQRLHASLLEGSVIADVRGDLDPVTEIGEFDATFRHVRFTSGENHFGFDANQSTLALNYVITPDEDYITVPKSLWKYNKMPLSVDAFKAPFDFMSLSGKLPTTYVHSGDWLKLYLTGIFNIKALQTKLHIDLIHLQTDDVVFKQTTLPLKVDYNESLSVETTEVSRWDISGNQFVIDPSNLTYKDSELNINQAHVKIEDIFESSLMGYFNTKSQTGHFKLKDTQAKINQHLLLKAGNTLHIKVTKEDKTNIIKIPQLALIYRQSPKGWKLHLNKITKITRYSPWMQDYNITNGSLHAYKTNYGDKIKLYGEIGDPYTLLVKNNHPLELIKFKGDIKDNKLSVTLNDAFKASYRKNHLNINVEKAGFNIFSILDFIKDHQSDNTEPQTPSRFVVDLKAQNSYLYIDESRRAPADRLSLQYKDSDLLIQLLHGANGGAGLEYINEKLFIYGDHFNDKFMTELAEFSDFKGGELSFSVSGKLEHLDGIVEVKNTIVKNYKALNNLFALINTIPALVTFSAPNYNKDGLKITRAYTGFYYEDQIIYIKGFQVNSEQLTITGQGIVNLETKNLDIDTSISTTATNNLSKIPLLGYILVGKESNNTITTYTIKGPIADPKVDTTLAKDIVIAPFNILRRAITFPIHYIDKAVNEE